MASQERRTLSAFPAPPSFYASFTTDKLDALEKLRGEKNVDGSGELSAVDAPPELEHLIPPRPPVKGQSWYVFGETRTLPAPDLPFLDGAGTNDTNDTTNTNTNAGNDVTTTNDGPGAPPRLHPLPPTPASVARLARSALLAFLELAHVLARDPTPDRRFGSKWEDVRDVLVNAHRAANLFRPWAARQQVQRRLRARIAAARAEMAAVDALEAAVDALLLDLGRGGDGAAAVAAASAADTAASTAATAAGAVAAGNGYGDGGDGGDVVVDVKREELGDLNVLSTVQALSGDEMDMVIVPGTLANGEGLHDKGSDAKVRELTRGESEADWSIADDLSND